MKYRPEIDGLRATAVLPVILFHAGVPGFEGGYVGVDVFFVISGYLITTILLSDLASGTFSFSRFYERRARRILPALFVVVLTCVPFAWLWMLPSQLSDFGKSLGAVATFLSNVFFWRQSGYFEAAAELKPLLHTWSLAVEEQYYIIFPFALWGIWRINPKLILPALLLSIAGSLALAEWGSRNAPLAAFFLAPTRFWEILTGSLCAWLARHGLVRSDDVAGMLGLALVLMAVLSFDATTPTPSLWTLLPVVGTALVILFGSEGTVTARVLRFTPLVWIGLISYSAYLWHQPLLAFARIRLVAAPSGPMIAVLVVATLVLAWFSWRFVEQPFRRPAPLGPSKTQIFAWTAAGLTGTLAGGLLLWQLEGAPFRTAPSGVLFSDLAQTERMLRPNKGLAANCDAGGFTLAAECRTAAAAEVLLWGDSYAMHLAPGLMASPTHSELIQHTLSACGPFPGLAIDRQVTPWRNCIKFNDRVIEWLEGEPGIRVIVLSSAFSYFDFPVHQRDDSTLTNLTAVEGALRRSLIELAGKLRAIGKRVVFISPPPRTGEDLGQCFIRQRFNGLSAEVCNFGRSELNERTATAFAFLRRIEPEIPVLWLDDLICDLGSCATILGSISLYRDEGHLSVPGSEALGSRYDLMGRVLRSAK